MSSIVTTFFGQIFGSRPTGSAYLPDIFPIPIAADIFTRTDTETVYSKILTDVVDRCEGLTEDQMNALWDNCLMSEAPDGLITMLAKGMARKEELFLVFKEGVIRRANTEEQVTIKADYKKVGKSSAGVYVSFQNYHRTDMVNLYSAMEYGVISSLYKSVNLSKAVQYKINDLRASVSLVDMDVAKTQAGNVASALSKGKDVMLDAKDSIDSHKPDLEAAKSAIEFLDSKRCFYIGLPRSWVNGEQPGGLGDSGDGDAKAVERGLKNYFVSIVRPVVNALFNVKLVFKPSDMAQVSLGLEALKTFGLLTDQTLLDEKTQKQIVERLFLGDTKEGNEQ